VCLRDARPAVMIEKEALDAIERPFTDFDRARWDYTSREFYITAIQERYPEVCAASERAQPSA
jgi:hypothetical protein